MTRQAVAADKLAPPARPFSTEVRSNRFIYVSGQIGQDPATGKLVDGGVPERTERIFANLALVLEAAGKLFADVIRSGVYLTDIASFASMNAVYAKHSLKKLGGGG